MLCKENLFKKNMTYEKHKKLHIMYKSIPILYK
jgi:hypothetical protein